MAVSQDNVQQQQPVTHPPQGAAGGEAQSADVDLSQALEQQITHAFQPVLDEFRQRMAQMGQELSDQMAAMPIRGAGQADTGQEAPQGPEGAPQQREGEQALEPQPQQAPTQVQHVGERPLVGALTSAAQTAGRTGEQWLQSGVSAGMGALLAETTHAAVQQRAEQGLHTLLQKAFEAAPADFANQQMREKAEGTLQLILREALGALFAEGVRASVQKGGQQTIQPLLRGDFSGALRKGEEALQIMMAALITVLRRHQQTLVRLLLALLLLGVGSSLEHSEKAK